MKAIIEVALKPFTVPHFVLTEASPGSPQDGIQEAPKYRLDELSSEVLEQLCAAFKKAVFEKAGKPMPPAAWKA